MRLIEWINGVTKLNKATMDEFQNNINDGIQYSSIPLGAGCDYYGSQLPSENYLWADGSAISRTEYSELFAIIGTAYGDGDGSTTFNLPDRRTATSVMYKQGDAMFGTLGDVVGDNTHTLTITEMPAHNHSLVGAKMAANGINSGGYTPQRGYGTNGIDYNPTISTEGEGVAFSIVQKSLVCNYIIRVK